MDQIQHMFSFFKTFKRPSTSVMPPKTILAGQAGTGVYRTEPIHSSASQCKFVSAEKCRASLWQKGNAQHGTRMLTNAMPWPSKGRLATETRQQRRKAVSGDRDPRQVNGRSTLKMSNKQRRNSPFKHRCDSVVCTCIAGTNLKAGYTTILETCPFTLAGKITLES